MQLHSLEYKRVEIVEDGWEQHKLCDILTEYSRNGWDLVQIIPIRKYEYQVILSREKYNGEDGM